MCIYNKEFPLSLYMFFVGFLCVALLEFAMCPVSCLDFHICTPHNIFSTYFVHIKYASSTSFVSVCALCRLSLIRAMSSISLYFWFGLNYNLRFYYKYYCNFNVRSFSTNWFKGFFSDRLCESPVANCRTCLFKKNSSLPLIELHYPL